MYEIENDKVIESLIMNNSIIKFYKEINQIKQTVNDNVITKQWTKFNPETQVWENDITNNNIIQHNGVKYNPINGEVIIPIVKKDIIIEPTETELLRNEVSDLKSQLSELIAFLRGG